MRGYIQFSLWFSVVLCELCVIKKCITEGHRGYTEDHRGDTEGHREIYIQKNNLFLKSYPI